VVACHAKLYDAPMIRGATNGKASIFAALLAGLFWLLSGVALADGVVNLPSDMRMLELTEHGTRVAAQRRNLKLDVPGETDTARAVLELRGEGPGPEFNWTIYTLRNDSNQKRAFILAIDTQRFAASGLVRLQPFGSQLTSVQWLNATVEHIRQASTTADAYRFELEAAQSITVGLEGRAILNGARVYDVPAFAQRESSLAFLRGGVLAVIFVLALAIGSLYGIRSNRAFLVGGFFGLAALLFAALESGYFDPRDLTAQNAVGLQNLRALVESLFALSVGLLLWGVTGLQRRTQRQNLPYLVLLLCLLCLVGFSVFVPQHALKIARWGTLIMSFVGFFAAIKASRRGADVMDNAVLFWGAFLVWTCMGGVAAVGESQSPSWHAAILTGLAGVVGLLGFASLRLAFSQGFLSKPYLRDSSRRSLALTGAQHYLWDWQPQDNVLDVGTELARSLGHASEKLNSTGAARWFAALLHPADELAYRKSLDLRGLQPNSFIEQELRLRNSDGEYQWFALRARALPGPGGLPSRMIGTLTNITRNKQTEDKLINETIHDPVTGLPSRALFLDQVTRDIAKPLALPRRILMVAIERFKILNEGLGHDLGDQLLMEAGQRIAQLLKDDESVARISGSRFAVMHVESIDSRSATDLAEEIINALAKPVKVLSQEVYLSACIGISLSSQVAASADAMQRQAATALHEAQGEGPRSVVGFRTDITDERAENVALESDLRRALDGNEIEVLYQPILNLLTREAAGFEALARWRHPKRGVLLPAEFIGLAEQVGMIREIGDVVMTEAVRQMGIWQRVVTRNRPIFMSINVSADQLSDTQFIDQLNMAIAREGVFPSSFKVEITESVVMRYPERARHLIQRLRTLGIGVACDDFGTGFSNLASLRDLAFDTLKVDRSFLSDGGLQGRGGLILRSMVAMAHNLGMTVVAEGIETEEQARHLLSLGCEWGQGYGLGKPMAPRDVHNLLAVLPRVIPTQMAPPPAPWSPPARSEVIVQSEPHLPQYAVEEVEPEELPSLFSVYETVTEKKAKPAAKKKPSAKAKSTARRKAKPTVKKIRKKR
jgi:diguanylate cyclase (GGDEF)-like protein